MSCTAGSVNFRLLDAFVGWDPADSKNLDGLGEATGVYLKPVDSGAVDPNQVLLYLPPARLARGCGPCEWYLTTPFPPESRLLRRDACHPDWEPVWQPPCAPDPFVDAVAVAVWRQCVAVADRGANTVRIWAQSGARLVTEIATEQPGPIAFRPYGELLIVSSGSARVARYGLDGAPRGYLDAALPVAGAVTCIAVDRTDQIWVVVKQGDSWILQRVGRDENQFKLATVDDLSTAFTPTGLLTASDTGFCFDADKSHGLGVTRCYSWYGRPLNAGDVVPPSLPARQRQGQLLTAPIDSGIPRCRWHRVRLDADLPTGTALSVAVATAEDSNAVQGVADSQWADSPAGQPHPSDWTASPTGSLDLLIDQPPGRYLFVRLRLTGNGIATPVVRRVRIDFPRLSSLEHLPAVYRDNPKAEDFTERFLSLFDASIEEVDRVIERYPALLDPAGVPHQLLPWLGGFFDIGFDSTWDAAKRRAILANAPELYRRRGTLAGLELAIRLVFGVTPAIEELSSTGMWGGLGSKQALQAARCEPSALPPSIQRNARLRATRLFGRTRARFRLGRSPIGRAALRSYGNPDQDPFAAGAYRFRVSVPPLPNNSKEERDRLTNLIEAQKPAHTVASVRIGGTGFLLGAWSAVGVDTAFLRWRRPFSDVTETFG